MSYRVDLDTEEKIPTGTRETSIKSRDKTEKVKNEYRQKIYQKILHAGGLTCDEVEVALGIRHQTASCFIRFLTQDGFLYPARAENGEIKKRITRAGRSAIVWVALLTPKKEEEKQKELF